MQTNNELYKEICENMNIPVEQGVHNNNYYLKRIATYGYGKSYTGTVCNGILIKDIAEAITGNTYTGHHFNNFYLKDIASALSPGGDYNNKYDNYLLNIWAENSTPLASSLLMWQVPPTDVEYSDFNATGLLTDADNNPISDATVYLLVGSTKVDNAQTNSNGIVTFTNPPVHTGTHTFKLLFEGNVDFAGTESSTATIIISKETTYLNITERRMTGYTDGTLMFKGQLLDNDSPRHFVAGKPIKIMNAITQEVYDRVQTDSNGEFISEYTISSAGTYSVAVLFAGDDDYVHTGEVYVDQVNVFDPSISLVGDNSILSYADEQQTAGSQVCTVTATVNSGVSQEREVMSFTVKNSGGTVVETGSAIVDSSNQCEYEYVSKGLGDVTVEAEATVSGILSSETFALQDCWKYDGTEHTETYSSSLGNTLVYEVGLSDCIVELDVQTSGYNYLIAMGQTNESYGLIAHVSYGAGSDGGRRWVFDNDYVEGSQITSYYHLKWVRESTNLKLYLNDSLITDVTDNRVSTLNRIVISSWRAKTLKYKNLKVKPL